MSDIDPVQNNELLARLTRLEAIVKTLAAGNSPDDPSENPPSSDPEDDPDNPPKGPTPPSTPDGGPGMGLPPEVRSRFEMIEARLTSLEDGTIPPEVLEDLIEIIRMIHASFASSEEPDQFGNNASNSATSDSLFTSFISAMELYQTAVPAMLAAQAQVIQRNLDLATAGAASGAELVNSFVNAVQELQGELGTLKQVAGRDVSIEATAAVKKATDEVRTARRMQQDA